VIITVWNGMKEDGNLLGRVFQNIQVVSKLSKPLDLTWSYGMLDSDSITGTIKTNNAT
jgi:hypothetical protein